MDKKELLSWVEIDLDALDFNVRQFKNHVGSAVEVIAVVKANAYGHGMFQAAKTALQAGATRLAVSRIHEGVELRKQGIRAPVLLMGYTLPGEAVAVVNNGLTPSVITAEFARALSGTATAAGRVVPVHVKVDTGMSRYGLLPDEVIAFLKFLANLPGLKLEGLFTHFATADSFDQTVVLRQLELFKQVIAGTREAGFEFPLVHACNSAAAMRLQRAHFNAIRPGIGLYGLDPSSEWEPVFEIRPVLSLKSRVARVRWLQAGAGVSYGFTFITQKPTLAALVPVGYGDGFHRSLSNKGQVLINGQRAPIIGRVCMDQFVVDISKIQDVKQDDEVVLVGRQGENEIRAEEVADLAGTINYEVTTSLLPRLPRLYLKNGEISEISDKA